MADTASHIVHLLPLKMALIGGLGIGAQWLAWKLQKPLRLNPVKDFGDLLRPVIGISVAIILFEGGLTLKLGTLSAHYIVNLPWDISAMVGGLFVVTGPTVIIPLLRQAHLSDRPANVLKWEGIVNDPVGALLAVGAYEYIRYTQAGESLQFAFGMLVFAAVLGTVVGVASGYGLAWAFRKGHIPEYLKAPVVMAWVLLIYVLANELAEETGLLAVTAMGITMANTKYAAMVEMRRFKETIAVLLVSGVFVILTATLTPPVIKSFVSDPKIALFVLAVMFLVRPIAVFIGTACHRSGLQLHGNANGENSGIGN